jgi:hypothetical protein
MAVRRGFGAAGHDRPPQPETRSLAGMLVAEQQYRRIIGYRHLAKLVIAVERLALRNATKSPDRHEVAKPVTV